MWSLFDYENMKYCCKTTRIVQPNPEPENSSNLPKPNRKMPESTTPTIGSRSPTKPDTFRSVGGFPPPKSEPLDPIIKPKIPAMFEGFFTKTYKNRQYLEFYNKDYLKSHEI